MPPPKSVPLQATNQIKAQKPISVSTNKRQAHNIEPGYYSDLEEDLNLALNMSDSFTCSMPTQPVAIATQGNQCNKVKAVSDSKEKKKHKSTQSENKSGTQHDMDDSLTFSMIANVLEESSQEPVKAASQSTNQKLEHVISKPSQATVKTSSNPEPQPGTSRASTLKEISPNTIRNDILYRKGPAKPPPGRNAQKNKAAKRKSPEGIGEEMSPPKQKKVVAKRQGAENSGSVKSPTNESMDSDSVPPTPPELTNSSIAFKTPGKSVLKGCSDSPVGSKVTPKSGKKMAKSQSNTKRETPRDLPMIPCSPRIPLTYQSFSVVDVAANQMLFDHFIKEWAEQTSFSFSLALEKIPPQPAAVGRIGANFNRGMFH